MSQPNKKERNLIEGIPALIVIDIQAETFDDRADEAIPTMVDYASRMLKARARGSVKRNGVPANRRMLLTRRCFGGNG